MPRLAFATMLALLIARLGVAQERLPAVAPEEDIATPAGIENGPFSLDRCVAIAMLNSPVLRQAQARIEQARGRAVQAGLYPNPQQNSGNPIQLGGQNSTYSTGIVQEVVRGGKLGLDVAAASENVRQAEYNFVRQRFELLTAVRQQFYALLAAQQRVTVLKTLLQTANETVGVNQKLFAAGQVGKTDLLLFRIELRRAEAAQKAAEFALTANRQQLAALIGVPGLAIDQAVGDLTPELPNWTDEDARRIMLQRNPLILAARVDISRNQYLLKRAQAEPTPNLLVQSGYQYTVNAPHNQALIGTYFNIPIWDRNQGNIRAAAASVGEAGAVLVTMQNDLLRQLADALNRYRSAQRLIESFEKSILPDAKETLRLVQQGYEQGQVDLLRLMQSQRALFEANLDYISAELNEVSAAAEVAGLLQEEKFP